MPSRCIWHYPALQWELQKVFPFFPGFRTKARIMHNENNSGTTGRVGRTLGFSGFLVLQPFQLLLSIVKN